MDIVAQTYKSIDFGFAELRFASVLRLPLTLKGAKNRAPLCGASSA